MNKKLFSFIIAVILTSTFLTGVVSANSSNIQQSSVNEDILIPQSVSAFDKALIDQRKVFGFTTENSVVSPLITSRKISEKYGFYLSANEEKALDERFNKQDKFIPILKETIRSHQELKENFLGIYIDQNQGGIINVGFKKDIPSKQLNFISKSLDNELPIRIYTAEYTEEELDKATNRISESVTKIRENGINIEYVNLDFINQKITVGIRDHISESALDIISSVTDVDASIINLEVVDPTYKTSEDARTDTHTYMLGGLVIDGKAGGGGNCSIGFSAIDPSSNPYIVTAEHCWPKASGTGVYQGNNYIGYTSSKVNYGNEADAAAIRLNSSNSMSSKVYSESIKFSSVQVAGNDVLGERVCKSGMWGNSCGTLLSKNSSRYWTNPVYGTVWFSSMRVANYISDGGDSGGTIWNNNNGELKGVHKGVYTENGTTYRVYSHVTHIQNRLGITPVTW
ncbi:S1 family peptidase [Paenibacillus sp. FSL W8-0426]